MDISKYDFNIKISGKFIAENSDHAGLILKEISRRIQYLLDNGEMESCVTETEVTDSDISSVDEYDELYELK